MNKNSARFGGGAASKLSPKRILDGLINIPVISGLTCNRKISKHRHSERSEESHKYYEILRQTPQDDNRRHCLTRNRKIGERCRLMRGAVNSSQKAAFTLAEMMVVLLILSITLAAMAPVMTTKAKHDRTQNSSPWRWVGNSHTHAYFGQNNTQMGMIGQKEPDAEDLAKLIINNTNNDYTHMLFKNGDSPLARLGLTEDSISLGSGKVNADGKFNTAFGIGALASNTTNGNNTAVGYYALNKNNGGEANVAVGDSALKENTTGVSNIAIGSNALAANTTKSNNIAIGENALAANTTGNYNIAIGIDALKSSNNEVGAHNSIAIGTGALKSFNAQGYYLPDYKFHTHNIAIGKDALSSDVSGIGNTALGSEALSAISGYQWNTAIGSKAMQNAVGGHYNVAVGAGALANLAYSNSSKNTAIGYKALHNTKVGDNTAVGYQALYSQTEKTSSSDNRTINTAVGVSALYSNTIGSANVAMGYDTMYYNTSGNSNTAIGIVAMQGNTTASYNAALGAYALAKNKTGNSNVVLGYAALMNWEKASRNIAIGHSALGAGDRPNKEVSDNIAIGSQALVNGSGNSNVAIGTNAMYFSGQRKLSSTGPLVNSGFTPSNNVAIGHNALHYGLGNNNVAIGYQAMYNSGEQITSTGEVLNPGMNPNNSIAIGYRALYNPHNGNNTALGYQACHYVSGSNKTCIGANSGPGSTHDWAKSDDTTERIFIGSRSKFNNGVAVLEVHNDSTKTGEFSNTAVVINGNLLVDGLIFSSNRRNGAMFEYQSRGDNNGHTGDLIHFVDQYDLANHFGIGGTSTNVRKTSDRRLKYVGAEFKSGLDKIRQLKVFNYTFKKDKEKTPHVGVIAQDLEKIFPNAVTKNKDGFLMIRMEDMFYALVNAVKELDEKLTVILNELKDIKTKQIEILRSAQNDKSVILNEIKRLEKQNAELKARLDKLEKR